MIWICLLGLLCTATLAFWPVNAQAPNPARAAVLAVAMLGSALITVALGAVSWWESLQNYATDLRGSLAIAALTSACAAKGLLRHRPAAPAMSPSSF